MNLLRILPAIILGCLVITPVSADIKTATVDVNKLITHYNAAKKEITRLQAKRDVYIKERVKRQKAVQELTTKLNAIFAKLRDKAMPKMERDNLNEQREELMSQYNSLNKDIQEADFEQMKSIKKKLAISTRKFLNEIQAVIGQYAKDNGYQWIIESSGVSNTQISPLIYARNAKDITDDILAILNKDAPKEEKPKPETPKDN